MCKGGDRKVQLLSYLLDSIGHTHRQLCIEGPKLRPQGQFRGRSMRRQSLRGTSITRDLPRLLIRPEDLP